MHAKPLLIVFLAVCTLLVGCNRASASTTKVAKIAGSWDYKDFPGLVCEFKTAGKYHARMVTKEGVTISANGTYSIAGSKFTGQAPNISTNSSDLERMLMWRMMTMTNPAQGTITWKLDDEFSLTHRNELRGVDETITWKRQAAVAGPVADLISTASRGEAATVKALLSKGADANAKDKDGVTVLHLASVGGHLDVVQALLENGADVNAKDKDGVTVLHLASVGGHLDVVQALLGKGVDVNAKLNNGGTALGAATEAKHAEVRALLVRAGAKQ